MNIRSVLPLVAAALAAQMSAAQTNVAAAPTNKVLASARVFLHAEGFEWKETLQGREFVKEDGVIGGFGGEMELRLNPSLLLGLHGEFFFGEVDYDGVIQQLDGTFTPTESSTTYTGLEGDAKLIVPFAIGKGTVIKPAAGLGLRAWERTLDSSLDSRYIGANGYIEDWATAYGIIGVVAEFSVSPATKIFGAVEVRLPFWTQENIDLSNVAGPDDVELEPDAQTTLFAEAGVRYRKLFASFFVETLDFDESDYDDKYGSYLQPASEATIAGLRAGVWF